MRRVLRVVMALVGALACVGCGPSVWERSFAYEPGEGPSAPTASVVVREAPWERVAAALAAEREAIAGSDVHREDWSTEQARELELALLQALQLPVEAGETSLIGRSNLKTTRATDPKSGEMATFARSIGADYAIWSSQLLGKAETIEQEPIERDRWRWERIWDARRDRFVYVRRWEPETVWVPVVVERDEMRFVVFYVKRSQ